MSGILWTFGLIVVMLACGVTIGRYLVPYRAPHEDWSDKRLIAELNRIHDELDLRDIDEDRPGDDWPDDDELDAVVYDGRDGDIEEHDPRYLGPGAAPEPASQPNNPPDGWNPAPGDRIAAWARTGPREGVLPLETVPSESLPVGRVVGVLGQPRRANRFMDLVAQHLTEYDLHHMQRAAA